MNEINKKDIVFSTALVSYNTRRKPVLRHIARLDGLTGIGTTQHEAESKLVEKWNVKHHIVVIHNPTLKESNIFFK